MANWWDSAPLATQTPPADPQASAAWWDAAPLAQQPQRPTLDLSTTALTQAAPAPPGMAGAQADDAARLQQWEQQRTPQVAAQVDRGEHIRRTVASEMAAERAAQAGSPLAGMTGGQSWARRIMQGATGGWADEMGAVLGTPVEMIARGTINPAEAYDWAKARQDAQLAQARQETGMLGTAAEVMGGVGSGVRLAQAGLTAMPRAANAGLGARTLGAVADGAAYGAVTGAGEGSGVGGRLGGAAMGGATGAVIGGALPAVASGVNLITAPIRSNIMARVNPEQYAQNQVARSVVASGREPAVAAHNVGLAAREGQGVYTLADELGTEGRNLLASAANAPGPGREMATAALEARNYDAPRRLAATLQEASGTPQTAQQLTAAVTAARREAADIGYGAARGQAGTVNPSEAIRRANDFLDPAVGPVPGWRPPVSQIADDSVEAAVRRARGYLTDGRSVLNDFSAAQRAKVELDRMIETGSGTIQGHLAPIRNALDDALAAASPPYAAARDTFRRQSQVLEGIEAGQAAARRGRVEDTIPQFRGMDIGPQQGFRTGYFDDLIAGVQGRPQGPLTNAARPLATPALNYELPQFAFPGTAAPTMRSLNRENIMAQTNARVLGNSRTVENAANAEAVAVDPTLVANVLQGNFGAAARSALGRAGNALTGNTPAVREQLARILLSSGDEASNTGRMITRASDAIERQRHMLGIALRGILGGGSQVPANIPAPSGRR